MKTNNTKIINKCKKYYLLAKDAYNKAVDEYNFKYEDLFNKNRSYEKIKEILTNNGRLALLDMEQDGPLRTRMDFNSSIDYIVYLSQFMWFLMDIKTRKLPDSSKYIYINPYLD